jgi:dCMP deaminase
MTPRQRDTYMKIAGIVSRLSYCERRKVGCVIIKNNNVISVGYNGTPAGADNCCEDENFKTKPEVIHAEDNALRKCWHSLEGSSLFVTTAPCLECAEKIVKNNIKEVFYSDEYNHSEGINYLKNNSVRVERLEV